MHHHHHHTASIEERVYHWQVIPLKLDSAAVSDVELRKVGLQPVRDWRAFGLLEYPGKHVLHPVSEESRFHIPSTMWRSVSVRTILFYLDLQEHHSCSQLVENNCSAQPRALSDGFLATGQKSSFTHAVTVLKVHLIPIFSERWLGIWFFLCTRLCWPICVLCAIQGSCLSPTHFSQAPRPSGWDSVWRPTLRNPMSATWICTCPPLRPNTSGKRVSLSSSECTQSQPVLASTSPRDSSEMCDLLYRTNPPVKRQPKTLVERLRWVTLGYHYNWDTKVCTAPCCKPHSAPHMHITNIHEPWGRGCGIFRLTTQKPQHATEIGGAELFTWPANAIEPFLSPCFVTDLFSRPSHSVSTWSPPAFPPHSCCLWLPYVQRRGWDPELLSLGFISGNPRGWIWTGPQPSPAITQVRR